MSFVTKSLQLSKIDEAKLKKIARSRTSKMQYVIRSSILLFKAEGLSNNEIAGKLNISRNSVSLCIKKYLAGGIDSALNDAPRSGKPATISGEEINWIINQACLSPKELGYPFEVWTHRSLQKHIQEKCLENNCPNISKIALSKVQTILHNSFNKPFKIKSYLEEQKNNLSGKIQELLIISKQVEIQSETFLLLAVVDLQTEEVIPIVKDIYKGSDFIVLLEKLDRKYREEDKIYIIFANHSILELKKISQLLVAEQGRFEFVFAPKDDQRLNIIEGFFIKMVGQMLKGIEVKSKEELKERIYKYFNEINEMPMGYCLTDNFPADCNLIKKGEVV